MTHIRRAFAFATLIAVLLPGGISFAQDHHDDHHDDHQSDHHDDHQSDHHDNHGYVHHQEWQRGYHMRHEDWDRGQRIDYRHYHLNEPPRGYEWREVDGNYVLAAVATGIIASVIVASATGH
jgi:Ni/Co efflux regulator RcnB